MTATPGLRPQIMARAATGNEDAIRSLTVAERGAVLTQLCEGFGKRRGRQMVGYLGVAVMLNLRINTLRGLQVHRRQHAKDGDARPDDMPAHVATRGAALLFDLGKVQEWAVHTGRLAPDRVTPRRRKHARGPARTSPGK